MSRPCSDLPVVHTQVLGVDDPLACRALHDAIQSLPGGSGAGEEAVSPLEAVRRLLNQPVYVEAATAEELHAKVRSVLTVLGANHGPLECPPPQLRGAARQGVGVSSQSSPRRVEVSRDASWEYSSWLHL